MKKLLTAASLFIGVALVGFNWTPTLPDVDFEVPQGFAVEHLLDDERSGGPVALTFDSDGHLVVAKEFDHIVRFIDRDGDGSFEDEQVITDQIHTSQGMFFDGPDLLVVGSGPEGVGLYRVPDSNGDGLGDSVDLIELATGRVADHGPHAPFFGPDGYLYWTHGNFSNIYADPAPLSPVRRYAQAALLERPDPRGFGTQYTGGPGGVFLRKNLARYAAPESNPPLEADWELFANGFRNQYDAAFNLLGELITFDSDMEWDRDLPWYRPTRSVHVVPGGDYGYRENTAKHPPYYFDDLPPMEETGRGSPTGVAVLQTYNYPAAYWDATLQGDWSRGRILTGRLVKAGATYRQVSDNFVFATPLNITDLEVGPDGNVYFALGGRRTDGGVYRVVYKGPDAMERPAAHTPLDRVLTMIQPRSAFSRQQARETRRELGDDAWRQGLIEEIKTTGAPQARRIRAMELLHVFGPGLEEGTLHALKDDGAWKVRAATAYYLGLKSTDSARKTLVALLKDRDLFVQRRAAEALLRTGVHPAMNAPLAPVEDLFPMLAGEDRFVRYAGRNLLRQINTNRWKEAALQLEGYPQTTEALMAFLQTIDSPDVWDITRLARRELELLQGDTSDRELLDVLRVIQRTLIESHGVSDFSVESSKRGVIQEQEQPNPGDGGRRRGFRNEPRVFETMGSILLERFPTTDRNLNRELARTLAALQTPGAAGEIAAELANPENDREQQLFFADMVSFVESGWDEEAIEHMTRWIEKVYEEGWKGGAGFSGAIGYIAETFVDHIPDEDQPEIAGRIEEARPETQAFTGRGFGGPTNISDEELEEELIYNPNILQAEVEGGAWAFQKALCISCHTFGPIGTEFGPDLTTVNQRFSRADLVRAVMYPSEAVSDLWQVTEITKTNGERVSGTIYSEDAQNVRIQIPGGGQMTIPVSEIASRALAEVSPMPEGLINSLSSQERRDLFRLLEEGPGEIPDSSLARIKGP